MFAARQSAPQGRAAAKRVWFASAMVAGALHFLAGCAANPPPVASQLTDQRSYPASDIPSLREQARAHPGDFAARRELGVAYYEAAKFDSPDPALGPADSLAVATLDSARTLNPKDPRTLFYFAHALELVGEFERAMTAFREYGDLPISAAQKAALAAHVSQLNNEVVERRAREQVRAESENGIRGPALAESTLAFPAFASSGFPDSLGALGTGMAELIRADLDEAQRMLAAQRYQLVDRDEIEAIRQEFELARPQFQVPINLAESEHWMPASDIHGVKQILSALRRADGTPYYRGPMDESLPEDFVTAVRDFQRDRGHGLRADGTPDPPTQRELTRVVEELRASEAGVAQGLGSPVDSTTAPLIGRLLRASHIVAGSLVPLPAASVRATIRVVPVRAQAAWPPTIEHSAKLTEWIELEKTLAFDLFDQLGISLPDSVRNHIWYYRPTQSLPAFLAYSTGLSLLSTDPAAANSEFARAANIDPGFSMARARRDASSVPAPLAPPEKPSAPGAARQPERFGDLSRDLGIQTGTTSTPSAIPSTFSFPARPQPPRP